MKRQRFQEEIAKLLRFESSTQPAGTKVGLLDYVGRMKEGQRDIYYLSAPSRTLAEVSPYQEGMAKKDVEVLFCYEPYDELVLLQLRQFAKNQLTSVEKVLRDDKTAEETGKRKYKESKDLLVLEVEKGKRANRSLVLFSNVFTICCLI